ncbi:hypothetical protein PVAP13_1NG201200 [Panicum virgatum]|uniref:DUF4371 domain-containing protein n=1 Tax=Panicum virgatum TaxID=38727 RepID=A0A8T0WWJ1_PANVG|nr:hypothetical protein PVAP13_1NG201200 [Panicum virgatum]
MKRFFSAVSGQERTNATVEGGDGNEIEEPIEEAQTENAPQAQGIQIEEGDDLIKEFNQDHIISDPGLRIPIQRFLPNIRDQVKRAYLLTSVDSHHNDARNACADFKNQRAGVDSKLQTYGKDSEKRYKIRLATALDSTKYLIKQGLSFHGHDESSSSLNKGNYLEMIDSYKEKNEDDLVKACAQEVSKVIMGEIGDRHFSVLIDESREISIREQMVVVVRLVNSKGNIVERFLGLKHVKETSSEALKKDFVEMLGSHKLPIARIRGQGYDGASNMRGEFNGLHKLIRDDNPYAFYIHCFSHQLQLVVVARKDLLTEKHHDNILDRLDSGEILSGRGQHQMTSLVRPGDTRWGSHFNTLLRIESTWDAILPANNAGGLHIMESFNFVFIMKMMLKLFRITNELSQCLQRRDQNIVQAMSLLVDVKARLVDLRSNGWEELFAEVQAFCDAKKIEIPSMDAPRPRWGQHHYRVDTFYAVVDAINTEMNHRFNEVYSNLLLCFTCLDPRDSFSKFNVDKLVKLARIYDADFSGDDVSNIKDQLQTFIVHVRSVDDFTGCHDFVKMVETERHMMFPLVYHLIELALLLPVATASVERVVSVMKIIKTERHNKMDDDWLNDLMIWMNLSRTARRT